MILIEDHITVLTNLEQVDVGDEDGAYGAMVFVNTRQAEEIEKVLSHHRFKALCSVDQAWGAWLKLQLEAQRDEVSVEIPFVRNVQ